MEDGDEVRAVWDAAAIVWGGDVAGIPRAIAWWCFQASSLVSSYLHFCRGQRDVSVAASRAARALWLAIETTAWAALSTARSKGSAHAPLVVGSRRRDRRGCRPKRGWAAVRGSGRRWERGKVGRENNNSDVGDATTYLSSANRTGGQCGVGPSESDRVDTVERGRGGGRAG